MSAESSRPAERDYTPAAPQLWLYDFLVAVLTRESRWRRALLDQIAPSAKESVADIGCGVGSPLALIGTVLPIVVALCLAAGWPAAVAIGAPLAAPIEQALAKSKQLIIASMHKDGSFSEPAEVWFLYQNGKILVSSQANTWRVRRIKAGRPRAKLWVQNVDGPTFMATGKLVDDPKSRQVLMDGYAEKYKTEWPSWKDNYAIGFKNGTRVLIEYTPDPASSAPDTGSKH